MKRIALKLSTATAALAATALLTLGAPVALTAAVHHGDPAPAVVQADACDPLVDPACPTNPWD